MLQAHQSLHSSLSVPKFSGLLSLLSQYLLLNLKLFCYLDLTQERSAESDSPPYVCKQIPISHRPPPLECMHARIQPQMSAVRPPSAQCSKRAKIPFPASENRSLMGAGKQDAQARRADCQRGAQGRSQEPRPLAQEAGSPGDHRPREHAGPSARSSGTRSCLRDPVPAPTPGGWREGRGLARAPPCRAGSSPAPRSPRAHRPPWPAAAHGLVHDPFEN